MDAILRAVSIYFVLLIIFRISGKRTFAEVTPFDFVLLLIIAETTQQGLLGEDFSVTNCFILVTTLIVIDIGLSMVQQRSAWLAKLIEGTPVIVMEEGRLLQKRADRARISEGDILEAARRLHGLERLDQVKYAVLERHGGITIIPKDADDGVTASAS